MTFKEIFTVLYLYLSLMTGCRGIPTATPEEIRVRDEWAAFFGYHAAFDQPDLTLEKQGKNLARSSRYFFSGCAEGTRFFSTEERVPSAQPLESDVPSIFLVAIQNCRDTCPDSLLPILSKQRYFRKGIPRQCPSHA